jgi:hypothetical protein
MSYSTSPFIVTVTTAATLCEAPTPTGGKKRGRLFRNLSVVTIYLGGLDVTADTTSGWALAAGADFEDTLGNGAIYARVASGTASLQVWEVVQ